MEYAAPCHLFVAGLFTSIGGSSRNGLAYLDSRDATLFPWNPAPDTAIVTSIELSDGDGSLYVGGGFTSIDGQTRNGLAAVSTLTGDALAWDPAPDNANALPFPQRNHAGGNFVHEHARADAGRRLNTSTGLLTDFNLPNNRSVNGHDGRHAVHWRSFTNVNGTAQPRVAALDDTGDILLDWNPVVDGTYISKNAMAINRGVLSSAGDFHHRGRGGIGTTSRQLTLIQVNSRNGWIDPA